MPKRKITLKEMAKARIDRDMTQADLAKACGVGRETIAKLERTGAGSLDLKRLVAEVFHLPFKHLFPADAERLESLLADDQLVSSAETDQTAS